jgi:hypothetical protein
MQKIIFLDIDGPVINTPCYWVDTSASVQRSVMNTQAIGIVNQLSKLSGAKIVTNSTHNNLTVHETGRNLKQDLIKWGLMEELLHENWHTTMPRPRRRVSAENSSKRMWGIDDWIEHNGEADWICFDDEPFTENPRLFVIDFVRGIDYDVYLKVCAFWNIKSKVVFI